MMDAFKYSIAIRTLGTAGIKYQRELDSIKAQTVKPTQVIVYIPEGYPLPKETIGIEKYVRVKKGMITQRALNYEEIDDEWILLLDDDMCLPSNYIESCIAAIEQYSPDCISADLFGYNNISFRDKIKLLFLGSFPFRSHKWGYTIGLNGRFNYNSSMTNNFYESQTGAGGCILVKKKALLSIKLEDEIWMDIKGYPIGEDQILHYKLFLNGFHIYTYFNNGIINLDGAAGGKNVLPERYENNVKLLFVIWYRTCFNLNTNNFVQKLTSSIFYFFRFVFGFLVCVLFSIKYKKLFYLTKYISGHYNGYCFIRSKEYKMTRNFIVK